MPQIGNNLIINIKDTSVLNVISVTELYFASKSAAGVYYRYFEIFFITCVIYFIMTFTASRLLRWWEGKWMDLRIINWCLLIPCRIHVVIFLLMWPVKRERTVIINDC